MSAYATSIAILGSVAFCGVNRMKECQKCQLIKPLSAFTRHSWLPGDRRVKTCKDCYHRYRRFIPMLYVRDGFLCRECGQPLGAIIDPKKVQVDHIKPQRVGGTDDFDNLQLLHVSCNIRKIAKDQVIYG